MAHLPDPQTSDPDPADPYPYVPPPLRRHRPFPMDDALLLFDRGTGENVLLDGDETRGLRQRAPRSVQFAITNACNLACAFCSRDTAMASTWTADEAFRWLAALDRQGVLEVAFGGGEPLVFPGFDDLVARLQRETSLAVHVTTNGLRLDAARIDRLAGSVQECRMSLYDDNDGRATVARLAAGPLRFGVNYLLTPARLESLEDTVLELVALGCRDVLLLSYNGRDRALHLDLASCAQLAERVRVLARALRGRCTLKLDVCWGERLGAVPRLFDRADCGAGRDFVVLTSDKKLMPCSFHDTAIPLDGPDDVLRLWREMRPALDAPSPLPGCARTPDFGLARLQEAT